MEIKEITAFPLGVPKKDRYLSDHSDSHPHLVSSSPVEGAGEIIARPQRNYSNRGAPTLRPGDGVQDGEDPAHGAVTSTH